MNSKWIPYLRHVLLIALSFSATSCLQPPSATDDNGPAIEPSVVQAAIMDAWGSADFVSTKLNEFLYIEQDQKISTLDPNVVYKESTQVTDRVVNGENVDYKMLIRSTSLENGTFKPITSLEDEISVKNTAAPVVVPASTANTPAFPLSVEGLQKSMQDGTVGLLSGNPRNHFLGIEAVLNMLSSCVKGPNWDVTCHNLQVSEGYRSAPTGVSGQPDCGGLPNCQVHFRKVSFELVVPIPDKDGELHPEKVVYEMVFSSDVPYLSRLLDFCYQGMIPTATQKVVVKICNRVQNFQVGTD